MHPDSGLDATPFQTGSRTRPPGAPVDLNSSQQHSMDMTSHVQGTPVSSEL